MEGKTKILVADANESFRRLLVSALREEADMEVAAETGTGRTPYGWQKTWSRTWWPWT